jgi:cytochrome c
MLLEPSMSLEFNKLAGAVLGTLTFAMGVGFVAELIFTQEPSEKPGFEVAVAEEAPAADAGAAAEVVVEPIAVRLASADPAKGESLTKSCAACHVLDSSDVNKVGPGLWNIVNRKPGAHADFKYSAAMVEFGNANVWDYNHLDNFLANPKASVPGTKMAYAGMKKPEDRANLIAYLRTLADTPAPLPAADAAEAPAAEAPAEAAPAEAPAADAAPAEAPKP